MLRRRARSIAGVVVLSTLLGCGGGGGGGGSQSPPPPANSLAFAATSFTTEEDADLRARLTVTNPTAATLTFTRTSEPTRGTLVSLDAATGELVYRPTPDASGADSFGVRVADSSGNTATAQVSILISPVNDAPRASPVSIVTDEDVSITARVLASDPEGDALGFAVESGPASGVLSAIGADGAFTYEPFRQFVGADSFQVRISDDEGAGAVVTISVTVERAGVAYAGEQSQAVITEASAAQVAKHAWTLFTRLVALYEGSVPLPASQPNATVDVVAPGAVSGSARITGALNAAGAGALTVQYTNFADAEAVFNGRELIDIIDPASGHVRRTFKNTTIEFAQQSGLVNGSLERLSAGGEIRLSGDLVMTLEDGATRRLSNLDLRRRRASLPRLLTAWVETIQWTGSGRAYDPVMGYVELRIDEPLNFIRTLEARSLASRPIGRGALAAVGASQAKLWLTAPSPAYFAIELDLEGRGRPAKALAFRRDDEFERAAGHDVSHLVQAVALLPFDATYAHTGQPFFPEGRLSEHREGKYLNHQWSIDVAPPGSTVELADADTPRPSLTPDRAGSYLLRLDVSDGAASSTDYLEVQVVLPNQAPGFPSPRIDERAAPGASDVVDVGTEVTVDARKSYVWYQPDLPDYVWTVQRTFPDGAILVNGVPGSTVRFTPTTSGVYFAQFHRPDTTSLSLVTKAIVVRPAQRTAPQVRFAPTLAERPFVVDLDGDRRMDVIAETNGGMFTFHRRNAAGRFDDGVSLDLSSAGPGGAVWFEDLTGDGRLDLIRQPSHGSGVFNVAVQTSTGAFSPAFTLDNGARVCSFSDGDWKVLGAVDMDRDGRNDLVRSVQCGDGVNRWLLVNTSPMGVFGAGQELATPTWISRGAAADIDGDGDRDIIGTPHFVSTLPSTLAVLRLDDSGEFDAATINLSEPYTPGAVTLADLNGDGRSDVVLTRSPSFVLLQNADGTFAERGKVAGYFDIVEGMQHSPIADLTGDGRLDVLLPAANDDHAAGQRLLAQRADGGFELRMPYGLADGAFIDFNNDGRMDTIGRLHFVRIQAPQ